jgi:hypothetical protein
MGIRHVMNGRRATVAAATLFSLGKYERNKN